MFNNVVEKVAVVIGGTSGIGAAVTKQLDLLGMKVVAVGLSGESFSGGENISLFSGDMTKEDGVSELVEYVSKVYTKVDYLVNCIGYSSGKMFFDLDDLSMKLEISTNLEAPYLLIKKMERLMDRGGVVVNVSSIRARLGGMDGSPMYAATKAAIIGLTKSLSWQLGGKQIRVNCVVPGATYPTKMSMGWDKDKIEAISRTSPLGKISAPEDVAKVIVFLLSDWASAITGQSVDVNCGSW